MARTFPQSYSRSQEPVLVAACWESAGEVFLTLATLKIGQPLLFFPSFILSSFFLLFFFFSHTQYITNVSNLPPCTIQTVKGRYVCPYVFGISMCGCSPTVSPPGPLFCAVVTVVFRFNDLLRDRWIRELTKQQGEKPYNYRGEAA